MSKPVWSCGLNQSFFVSFFLFLSLFTSSPLAGCFSPNFLFPRSSLPCLLSNFDTFFHLPLPFPHPWDSILPFQRRTGPPVPIYLIFFSFFFLFFVSFLPPTLTTSFLSPRTPPDSPSFLVTAVPVRRLGLSPAATAGRRGAAEGRPRWGRGGPIGHSGPTRAQDTSSPGVALK